jgi:hypothetical protein
MFISREFRFLTTRNSATEWCHRKKICVIFSGPKTTFAPEFSDSYDLFIEYLLFCSGGLNMMNHHRWLFAKIIFIDYNLSLFARNMENKREIYYFLEKHKFFSKMDLLLYFKQKKNKFHIFMKLNYIFI